MAHGGARKGAGRKPGAKDLADREARARCVASGETPLEYMLRVMRDESVDDKRRDAMAQAAGPYLHARLASTELTGPGGGPIQTESQTTLDVKSLNAEQLRALASIRVHAG